MATNVYGIRLLGQPRVRRSIFVLVLAIVLVFRLLQFAVFTTQIQWGYDFSAYWQAGRHLLDGLPIYAADQLAGPYAPQRQFLYLYPPPLAAAVIPLSALFADYRAAEWLWTAIGAAIVVAVVLAVGRREGLFEADGPFGGLFAGRGRWLLVGLAFSFPPLIGELVLGNVHVLLLGLFALAWLGVRRGGRSGDAVAGGAIGLAAIVKVFPGVVVLWFLLTRRWAAVGWTIATALAVALVTLPVIGLHPWLDLPAVLANLSAPSDTRDTLAPTVWLAPVLGFGLARVVVTAAALVAVVWAARARPEPISFAVTVVASLLMAPALYHHYLAILILPFLLGLAGGVPLRWLALAYLLCWGGQQDALGPWAWVVNRGLPTAGALVLFGALLWARLRPSAARLAGTLVAPGTIG